MNLHVKKGDTVIVLAGKDKGKKGKILRAMPKEEKVIVDGVNKVSRHRKPKGRQDQGGILVKEAPIHVSNVMLVCPKCGKPTKTGHQTITEGDKKIKVRVCKQKDCGAIIKTADGTK